ncbi:MAG: lipopolysaccharide biosynthesis protein [Clostridia bacterium]
MMLVSLRRLESLLGRDVARGTLVGTLLMAVRVALQAAYLILAARALTAAGYGQFAAVNSLVGIVAPLAGLGSGMLMLKDVSRDASLLAWRWRMTLRVTLLSGAVFGTLLVPLAVAALPGTEWPFAAAVVAAEVLAAPVIVAAGLAFQALGRFAVLHSVTVLLYVVRIAAVSILLWRMPATTPTAFAMTHLAATLAGVAVALAVAHWQLPLSGGRHGPPVHWRKGLPYAASGVIGMVSSEVDKPLLFRLAGPESAGLFAAAFRLASAFTAPIGALVLASSPAFFREAAEPPSRPIRVVAIALGYAALAALVLVGTAWMAPVLLGQSFAASAGLMQWLAPWLVCHAARQIGCAALTTRGHQNVRVAFEGAAAIASAALNVALIPLIGALGAVAAVTITEAMVGACAWCFLLLGPGRRGKPETV